MTTDHIIDRIVRCVRGAEVDYRPSLGRRAAPPRDGKSGQALSGDAGILHDKAPPGNMHWSLG